MVKVDWEPILMHCFDQLAALGADDLITVVGYFKEKIIDHYSDSYEGCRSTTFTSATGLGLTPPFSRRNHTSTEASWW
ncbi:hypothetical protein [Natrinema sp. CBA1119]|uniref:hypothetical protein n=1 Tax=Natrinema sp. CBA1119 TaxID=1608465 RepID=UPI0020D286C9|nr:hypothetical protein [Natrinema sp. CBA1119]